MTCFSRRHSRSWQRSDSSSSSTNRWISSSSRRSPHRHCSTPPSWWGPHTALGQPVIDSSVWHHQVRQLEYPLRRMTPSGAGVGVSFNVYAMVSWTKVTWCCGHPRDLPGFLWVVASVEVHEDGAAAAPTTTNWDCRYEAVWDFHMIMDWIYRSVIFLPAGLYNLAINCIFILTYI